MGEFLDFVHIMDCISTSALTMSKVLLGLGTSLSLFSVKLTFRHAMSPQFEAPHYDKGPKHTRYHAFRGAALALGALITMNLTIHSSDKDRNPTLWRNTMVMAVAYFGGWWAPKPLLGLRTPSWMAEVVHIAAASFSVGALVMARPSFLKQ